MPARLLAHRARRQARAYDFLRLQNVPPPKLGGRVQQPDLRQLFISPTGLWRAPRGFKPDVRPAGGLKGTIKDPKAIGRDLGVRYLVRGSARRESSHPAVVAAREHIRATLKRLGVPEAKVAAAATKP